MDSGSGLRRADVDVAVSQLGAEEALSVMDGKLKSTNHGTPREVSLPLGGGIAITKVGNGTRSRTCLPFVTC